MSDLRSQLASAFDRELPEEPPADKPAATLGILDPDAHIGSDWMNKMQELRRKAPDAPVLPPRCKLAQAEQVGNTMVKMLKKAGRKREARELRDLQRAFLSRREKAAWAALKLRFTELGLSTKAYRALKQGSADPFQALARLAKADPAELAGMGHARLRELLA